jgi:hypothetical protein
MYKYEPSAGVLDETYKRLLTLRTQFKKELKDSWNEGPAWDIFGEDDHQKERENHQIKMAILYDKVELIEQLLKPFWEEEAYWRERWEERRCADMMRI